MRLQESQHLVDATARSWALERKHLLLTAAQADHAAQQAKTRQEALESQYAALLTSVEQEEPEAAAVVVGPRPCQSGWKSAV